MKKSITVSNLTLSLYLDYVRPAAIKAGLLEDAVTEDGNPYHVTDEAIAKEIESDMRCACFNAGYDGIQRTHEEYIAHEAEQMLYQIDVSIKYCKDIKVVKALQALRDAMTAEDEAEQEPTAAELPALRFERRGCEFFAGDKDNEKSDIGNYRITTPGEIVPLKDGRMMLFEFGCYDRQIWRYHNKRTGEKLKKPVLDSVFTCAMHIDTEYSKPEKTGNYEWRSSWRDLNMENEFYKTPRKYTEKNILDYVNSVSAVQYGRIEYV